MSVSTPKTLPQANGDFYTIDSTLSGEDQSLLRRVRAFLEAEVAPIITEYWIREEFPYQLLPKLAELHIMGLPYQGYGCPGKSMVLDGMLMMELARVDSSFATFRGVHSGLAMGSIYLCGSEEQKQRWLPPMARLETIGSFGLTEPLVGSLGRLNHHRPARGRHLAAQRPENMDRQRHLGGRDHHLGAGCSR